MFILRFMKKVAASILRTSAGAGGIGKFSVKSFTSARDLLPSGPKLLILNDKSADEIYEECFSEKALKGIIYNTLQQIHKSFCSDVDACVFVYHEALAPYAIESHTHITALIQARERNAEPFEYEMLMRKYKEACGKLIEAFNAMPPSEQDDIRSEIRVFVEQKFLEAGGILPIFLEIGELPADIDSALNATKDDLAVAVNECAQAWSVIPFGLAHANVKLGPLQFGWYSCSEVVIKKVDKAKGKCINCPLYVFGPKPLWLATFTACMLIPNRFDVDLNPILETCYAEFKSRFPSPMLQKICDKIYQYNHAMTYDVISRNCQHFALDFIATLGLDCKILTSDWLEDHIREFVQHPNCIMPYKMGPNAKDFIEFLLKPNNKQIITNNIGYAIVACGYWLADVQIQIAGVPSTEGNLLQELQQQEKVLYELYATHLSKFQQIQAAGVVPLPENFEEVAVGFSSAYMHSINTKRERSAQLRKVQLTDKLVSSLVFNPPPCSYTKTIYHKAITTDEFSHPVYYLFVPSGTKSARKTIIYSHGNAEDLGDVQPWLETLASRLDVNIIGYDYYGYGLSQMPGVKPLISQKTIFDDISSLWNHIKRQHKLTEDKVVLYGRSLGSAPTMYLASKAKFSGIIMESPFTSVLDVGLSKVQSATSKGFFKFFAATAVSHSEELIDNQRYVAAVRGTKALFLHGDADTVIPLEQSKILANGIQSANLVVMPGGTHNNLVSNFTRELLDEIGNFLERLNHGQRNQR